jgi:rubrerythrin
MHAVGLRQVFGVSLAMNRLWLIRFVHFGGVKVSVARNFDLREESYEHQTMYPDFIEQARRDKYAPAIVTRTQAKDTEEEHARLFSEALDNLDALNGSNARTYYVRTVCWASQTSASL